MAGQSLSDVVNQYFKEICALFLLVLLLCMLKVFLAMYNHPEWSGLDGIVPGVYNPN